MSTTENTFCLTPKPPKLQGGSWGGGQRWREQRSFFWEEEEEDEEDYGLMGRGVAEKLSVWTSVSLD